jgi:FkbM family methyltransferase
MSVKQWCKHTFRRAIGTQAVLDALDPQLGSGANGHDSSLSQTQAALDKFEELYQRILDPAVSDDALGFRRADMPCLIELNGDLLWMPADLLRFLWHTRVAARPLFVLHFLAETLHYQWIRERLAAGDVALDCGANMGLFSTMMAARVKPWGSVHAFEPSPGARRDLFRVLKLNQTPGVVVNACALSDACGEATFCDLLAGDVRREASHLDVLGRSGAAQGTEHQMVTVPTTTLDAYVAEKRIAPRLVKIDVEGAEFLVLEGARQCVAAHKPILVIEIHADEQGFFDHARLNAYLEQYGYHYAWKEKTYFCDVDGKLGILP